MGSLVRLRLAVHSSRFSRLNKQGQQDRKWLEACPVIHTWSEDISNFRSKNTTTIYDENLETEKAVTKPMKAVLKKQG